MTKQWMAYIMSQTLCVYFMVLHSLHHFGDCYHCYFILYEVDHYPNIEDIVYKAFCKMLSACDIYAQKTNISTSTCKLCSTKTSQAYSNFVLMKLRHTFGRVCLQRVHLSFLRILSCLKVQLLYIMVKSQKQVQRCYLLYLCT